MILLLAACWPAPAGQAQPWSGPAFHAPAAALLESAKAVEKTKGYDATVLMADTTISIDAAGRTTQRFRVVFRAETEQAAKTWASVNVGWEPWHQKQPEIRARVCTPDGVEHVLDPKTLSDAPAHQDSTEVYSDRRVYRGPLPAMTVGAVVEEEVLLQDTEPVFPGGAVGRLFAGARAPTVQTRFIIEAPAAARLKYEVRLLPGARITRTEESGITRVTIDQGKLDPIEITDTNLPPELAAWPQVEYSTAASWKEVAATYRKMAEPQIRVEQVAQIVRETVDAKDSREEKVRKLTVRLHKDVRYTGIEFGRLNIVPQPPAEVFKRKYGDCKDKATALAAMLRAADVPAYLVLVNAGIGQDVTPSLPGGNLFNHAIVLAPGKPDIWIDAADVYSGAGHLPVGDQGRYALPIREDTATLVRAPAATGMDNLLVEKREYRLSEFGPATVIETSEPRGFTDRDYRAYYSAARGTKRLQSELEQYAKNVYAAEGDTKVEISEGSDLSRPFVLRIEARKARRGYTSLRDARASIFLAAITGRLPDYFRKSDEDLKKEDGRRERPRAPRTSDFVLPAPFITEWQCKFVPPPGFKLRSMPESKSQNLGPARLVQRWEVSGDGTVTGAIRFDTVKSRYTAAEAEALREAVGELGKANPLTVAFDQEGYSLLAAGQGKAAIAAFDALIKLHPAEAVHRVQMASALLEVALGESARKQAREAVRLEPKSAMAHDMLAWVLQHDLIGRRFRKGLELEAALAEYRTALECDPEDNDIRANYAILLEYDAAGERYSAKANLAESIAQYRKLKEKKYAWDYLDGNLSAALFWAGRWKEVEELVGGLPADDENSAMLIAARTALEGAPAGIRRAAELTSGEKAKSEALVAAGTKLVLSRRYPEAADLWAAANTGDSTLERITAVRKTRRYEDNPAPGNDAIGTVRKMLAYLLGPSTPDPRIVEVYSKEWKQDGAEGPVDLDELKKFGQRIRYEAGSEFPGDARGDIILSNIKLTAEGDDKFGYRVMLQMMQLNGLPVYVTKAGGGYKIVPNGNASLGRAALAKLAEGDLKAARQWLDWAREENGVQGGEDPLAGSVFPRVWRRGQNGDAIAIQVAAAALLADHKQQEPLLPVLQTARARAATEAERVHVGLILFDAFAALDRWKEALATMEEVLRAYPDSDTAFAGYSLAAMRLKNWAALESAAQRRVERNPGDEISVMLRAEAAARQGDIRESLEVLRARISNPKAGMGVLNNYAWTGLFLSPTPADVAEIAQRAARLSENKDFGIVHTLAAVYADMGRVAEARKLIVEVMDGTGLEEPNEAAWYVFGRIAEQYGQSEAALAAYARTKRKSRGRDDTAASTSTWALAQHRARVMGAHLE